MGSINLKHTGSGSAIALSSDGTSLLLDGTAIGGGGGGSPDLFAENYNGTSTKPSATGTNAIAIGVQATASGTESMSLHSSSIASGLRAIAFGYGAYATTTASISLGYSAYTAGGNDVALGRGAKSTASYGVGIGNSLASGASSFAAVIDNNTTSYGAISPYGIAIGYQAKAGASDRSIAIGSNTEADYRSVAIGYNAGGTGSYGISLGANSGVGIYASSAAIGYNVQSTASNQVSIGGTTQDVRISEVYTLPKVDGSANEVLTTDGSGAVSWAAAGGGPMAFISTTTLTSAAADVEFSGLGTDYEYYKLFYRYTQPAGTSTQYLMWRGMISGSQVSSIYSHANIEYVNSGMNYGPSYTSCLLSSVFPEVEVSGEVTIYGIGKSNSRIMVHGNGVQQRSSARYSAFGLHSGYGQAQTGTWNGFAIKGLFYNLPIGATFSLYGIKNA